MAKKKATKKIKVTKDGKREIEKVEDYGSEEKKITYTDGTVEIVSASDFKE